MVCKPATEQNDQSHKCIRSAGSWSAEGMHVGSNKKIDPSPFFLSDSWPMVGAEMATMTTKAASVGVNGSTTC